MYLKLVRAFCFGGLAYRQKLQRVSGDAGGSSIKKVIARIPISSHLMSSKKSDVIKRMQPIKIKLELFDRFDQGRKFARENLRKEVTAPTVH